MVAARRGQSAFDRRSDYRFDFSHDFA